MEALNNWPMQGEGNPELNLREEFQRQAARPPSEDPYIGAMFQAFLEEPPDSIISKAVDDMTSLRLVRTPHITASEMAGTIRALFCTYLMLADPDFSYRGLTKPARWRPHLEKVANAFIENANDAATSQMLYLLACLNVQTNPPSRVGPYGVLLTCLDDRLPKAGANLLDIGSGLGQGPLQLIKNQESPLRMNSVTSLGEPFGNKNRRLTDAVNGLLAGRIAVQSVVCVDISPVYNDWRHEYNVDAIAFAEGSMRPTEHMNPQLLGRFRELLKYKPENLRYITADLTDDVDFDNFTETTNKKKFHAVSIMTMLHQLSRSERRVMMDRATELLEPGGMIYLQDFGWLPPSKHPLPASSLQMYQHWHKPGRYRGLIYDDALQEKGLQQAFYFKDSRCREMAIGDAVIAMDGRITPLKEAVKRRAAIASA